MASKYWLKLFHETIYDPKIMMRSPGARLRWYECLCLAGDLDRDGELPSIEHMVFVFRVSEEQLLDELSELARAGMIVQDGDVYIVKNWVKRQGQMPDAERKYRDRDSAQKKEYYVEKVSESVTENVRNSDANNKNTVRNSDADIDIDIDRDREEEQIKSEIVQKPREKEPPAAAPALSPQFFDPAWPISVFSRVTQMPGIPGSDLPRVMDALESLRPRFSTEVEMVDYLKPYFEGWIKRRTKDGRVYSKSNCAWLYDMALAGDAIPSPNKHPPRERPDPNCPKCGGVGMLASNNNDIHSDGFGKLVKCDCVRVVEEVKT